MFAVAVDGTKQERIRCCRWHVFNVVKVAEGDGNGSPYSGQFATSLEVHGRGGLRAERRFWYTIWQSCDCLRRLSLPRVLEIRAFGASW